MSTEQKLTSLGRAMSGLQIGDPLLIGLLLCNRVFEPFPAPELVALFSIFVMDKSLLKARKGSATEETELDFEADMPTEAMKSVAVKILDYARLLSRAYVECGLAKDPDTNWLTGCLAAKQYECLLKQGSKIAMAIQVWLQGGPFSEACSVATGVDAGTLAKVIRKLDKFVRGVVKAASALDMLELAGNLSGVLPMLQRGLPFLQPLLLRGWKVSEAQSEADPSWPDCPVEIGAILEMKPSEIGFSHRSCSACFQDGRSVFYTLTEILAGKVSPGDIEQLRIYWYQGMYYTLGNRRLCVYRLLEHSRPHTKILARVVSDSEAQAWNWPLECTLVWLFRFSRVTIPSLFIIPYHKSKPSVAIATGLRNEKFTSGMHRGARVLLRHTGEIIGKSERQSTFHMPTLEDIAQAAQMNSVQPSSMPVENGAVGYWHELCLGESRFTLNDRCTRVLPRH